MAVAIVALLISRFRWNSLESLFGPGADSGVLDIFCAVYHVIFCVSGFEKIVAVGVSGNLIMIKFANSAAFARYGLAA